MYNVYQGEKIRMERKIRKSSLIFGIMLLCLWTTLGSGISTSILNGSHLPSEITNHGTNEIALLNNPNSIELREFIYVGGANPGNYSTIQAGINAASLHDTVFVCNGIYYEHIVINKTIQLIGENRNATIIDGSGSGVVVAITAPQALISTFSVRNGGSYGIYANAVSNVTIDNCDSYQHGSYGIFVNQSQGCELLNTKVHLNQGMYAVSVRLSPLCTVMNCDISYNDGPIYNYYLLCISASDGTKVLNCTCYNGYYGIMIDYSDHCLVSKCTSHTHAGYGIHVFRSDDTTVEDCTAYDTGGFAIFVEHSSYCTVHRCSTHDALCGIMLYSTACFNMVQDCTVYNTDWEGIYLRLYCQYNTVMNCTAYKNFEGIAIYWYSTNNLVYHNNFYENEKNAYDDGTNQWNNGKEGNYWDDYMGIDADGNGIGDTPYSINGTGNQDYYPFMHPDGWLNKPPATPSQPTGQTMGILRASYTYSTQTIDPNGDNVYYLWDWGDGNNSGWLGPYPSGQIVSASYTWFNRGTYPIKVKAKDTSGLESPWSTPLTVNIYKLGDVNNDGMVTFADIDPFVAAIGTTETDFQTQHPTWSWLAADCNQDGQITFADIDPFVALIGS